METTQAVLTLLPLSYVAGAAIPLMAIDIKEHRLPNKIVLPMIGITLVSQLLLAILTGAWASLGISVGLGLGVMVLGIVANYYDWIGMGDVKLMAGLTMILSWFTVLGGALLMPVSIAIGIVIALIAMNSGKYKPVPMGPTILVTFATILAVTQL
jgi:leader peptidase (prepilin peptidase)/N-methyltransferase